MINKWIVVEPTSTPRKGCIIALPGRGISGKCMVDFCEAMRLDNTLVVAFEPHLYRWYPQPNGAHDQDAAIKGLADAVPVLASRIRKVQRCFRLKKRQIALLGYSAGSVMAIQAVASSADRFAAAVSLAGAILEPDQLPKAPNQTPVLLRHAINDDCFKWEERYLPMKKALQKQGYNLNVSEKDDGGHGVDSSDLRVCRKFFGMHLGYEFDDD